ASIRPRGSCPRPGGSPRASARAGRSPRAAPSASSTSATVPDSRRRAPWPTHSGTRSSGATTSTKAWPRTARIERRASPGADAHRASVDRDRLDLAKPRQHFLREEPDALLRFRVGHEARAAHQAQVAEAADLVVELHDLLVDAVGIAREQDA